MDQPVRCQFCQIKTASGTDVCSRDACRRAWRATPECQAKAEAVMRRLVDRMQALIDPDCPVAVALYPGEVR